MNKIDIIEQPTIINDEENQLELQTKEQEAHAETEDAQTESVEVIQPESKNISNIKKDIGKILFLIYLYFLQGIPIGLGVSVPFFLSSRAVSYSEQGTFSFASWPFSIKLLWAPIVDSIYIIKFGRRKSWLISIQFLIGAVMLSFADFTQSLVETANSEADIIYLTLIFFFLNFLAATQDICVDGWAITMLSKENVSWQSTCNNIGQSLGVFVSATMFIIFQSTEFSNKFIRKIFGYPPQNHGLVEIKNFMFFFGVVFLLTTVLVLFLKRENAWSMTVCCPKRTTVSDSYIKTEEYQDMEHEKLNLIKTYHTIFRIFKLIPIRKLAFVLLTSRIAFTAQSVTFLKLVEAGVTKEIQTLMEIPLMVLGIVWCLLISKYTNGSKSLVFYLVAIFSKIISSMLSCLFIFFLAHFKHPNGDLTWYFYLTYFVNQGLGTMMNITLFLAGVSFYAKISDKKIGGTYMTLLATLSNLGGMYPSTLGMYLLNFFNVKKCLNEDQFSNNTTNFTSIYQMTNGTVNLFENKCSGGQESQECIENGGICQTISYEYYYFNAIFSVIGIIWIIFVRKMVIKLNNLPYSEWKMKKK